MLRVRFAPSPTGYLHIGSARTFVFNWLYVRHNHGTMILRIDDTDVERNTQASLDSIMEGLAWLDLTWDEFYRQSERGDLHRRMANEIFAKGFAYRDFTPAAPETEEKAHTGGQWLCSSEMRELSPEDSDRRAAAGEPFVLRYRVPRETRAEVVFHDLVYGPQSKATADIEDFALLRSSGVPTYHMASCADDADLNISHIVRGQDHLTNTFKHVLIFEALGVELPKFAHLPLLIAPDGSKLSKRKHGPVVSVTTYRDAGFLPEAFINFVVLLGWSPKNDREKMTRQELTDTFSLEGVNRSNATINFTDEDPFDPKAVWLNAEHIRAMPVEELAKRLLPFEPAITPPNGQTIQSPSAVPSRYHMGISVNPPDGQTIRPSAAVPSRYQIFAPDVRLEKMEKITPLIQERIKLLGDVATVADFFFVDDLPAYDPAELIPQKGDLAMARLALEEARTILATVDWNHDALDAALRGGSQKLKIKAGQMFQPIRVAVCGKKDAPPLFSTLEVLGRETCLKRIGQAIEKI